MRIIDKNTDFYDYLQSIYPEDTLVFDRTDSFNLTKDVICDEVTRCYDKHRTSYMKAYDGKYCEFMLLQAGNYFWLFIVELTKFSPISGMVEDYIATLVTTWRDYSKPRTLLKFDLIKFGWEISTKLVSTGSYVMNGYDIDKVKSGAEFLKQQITTNNYTVRHKFNKHAVYVGEKRIEKHIPIFKASGFAQCINPQDMFLALDEYFSLEKSSSEKTSAEGTTNEDKIVNHGFDKKTSFRNIK